MGDDEPDLGWARMIEQGFRPLNAQERLTLDRLLTKEFIGRDEIRRQLEFASVKTIDADGSLKIKTSCEQTAPVEERIPTEAMWDDRNGLLVGILLHVVNGYVDELEIVSYSGQPIAGHLSPDEMRIEKFGG